MTLRAVLWCAVSTQAQAEDAKVSLPQQEADARALCARHGWRIVDVLLVPGHSRHYLDIHECAADMQRAGIDAFLRLIEHWQRRDFDVLICRDSERFARTQSLHARVVEETIAASARIYSLADGWVDSNNFRMFIAMAGYKAASDVERLVKGRKKAMDENARRGLPTTSSIAMSHRIIRDEFGRAQKVVPDESKRVMIEAAARIVIEGHGWNHIERILFERYGFTNPKTGRPYRRLTFYQLFHTPTFWGHSARHFRDYSVPNGTRTDMWVFDESEPLPEGVLMYRNTFPAAITGKLARELQDELRRRRMVVRGNARPRRTRMFSGLMVCDECGYYLVYGYNKGYPGYKCVSHYLPDHKRPDCTQHHYSMNEPAIKKWMHAFIAGLLEGNPITPSVSAELDEVARLERDLEQTQNTVRVLIAKQAAAGDELAALYDEQIQQHGAALKHLQALLRDVRLRQQQTSQQQQQRAASLEALRGQKLKDFWRRPSVEINQVLHALFGRVRLYVRDGKIIDVRELPR